MLLIKLDYFSENFHKVDRVHSRRFCPLMVAFFKVFVHSRSIFKAFVNSRSQFFNFTIKMGYRVCSRVPKIKEVFFYFVEYVHWKHGQNSIIV